MPDSFHAVGTGGRELCRYGNSSRWAHRRDPFIEGMRGPSQLLAGDRVESYGIGDIRRLNFEGPSSAARPAQGFHLTARRRQIPRGPAGNSPRTVLTIRMVDVDSERDRANRLFASLQRAVVQYRRERHRATRGRRRGKTCGRSAIREDRGPYRTDVGSPFALYQWTHRRNRHLRSNGTELFARCAQHQGNWRNSGAGRHRTTQVRRRQRRGHRSRLGASVGTRGRSSHQRRNVYIHIGDQTHLHITLSGTVLAGTASRGLTRC